MAQLVLVDRRAAAQHPTKLAGKGSEAGGQLVARRVRRLLDVTELAGSSLPEQQFPDARVLLGGVQQPLDADRRADPPSYGAGEVGQEVGRGADRHAERLGVGNPVERGGRSVEVGG